MALRQIPVAREAVAPSLRRLTLAVVVCLLALVVVAEDPARPSAAQAAFTATPPPAQDGDAFTGPFASWTDVRVRHGAVGDGVADDTPALQAALDHLAQDGQPPVLYIPAGTYRLTAPLRLTTASGVRVVGEDPERTRLVWDGPAGGVMLLLNGVEYSELSRLSFDGRRRASVAVDQNWDGSVRYFDTGNLYADDRFVDVGTGIRGGQRDHGFAETSVVRARFIRNTTAGIALGNFNALDLWVWQSLFDECGVGITNDPGAGNYRVYGSVFRRSRTADLYLQNTGGFTARGNYSIGSHAFWMSGQAINHPSTIDVENNTILDPESPVVIRIGNQGPGLLLDNRVRSLPNTAGPIVRWTSLFGADLVSVGNTFTVSGAVQANGRLVSLDDRIVLRDAVDVPEPALPGAPPLEHRRVYEVAPGSTSQAVQSAIDRAVADGTVRPIVHLPAGTYGVERTIVVPPSDVQLVGDGLRTLLEWRSDAPGPLLVLRAPSRATLRDVMVRNVSAGEGIVVEGLDHAGSRVRLDGVQLRGGDTNLLLDATGAATIDAVDIGHADAARVSVVARGTGRAVLHSGASSGNRLSYSVADGASLVARDIWYEGTAVDGFARVLRGGSFVLQGSRVATPAGGGPPAMFVDAGARRFGLLTTQFDDRIEAQGSEGAAAITGVANLRSDSSRPAFTNSTPPVTATFVSQRQRVPTSGLLPRNTVAMPDTGSLDTAPVRAVFAELRRAALPTPQSAPPGASDVRLVRVWSERSRTNLRLSGR